jgi:hypothetical protein
MSEASTHERLDAEFAREMEENQLRLRGGKWFGSGSSPSARHRYGERITIRHHGRRMLTSICPQTRRDISD